MQRIVVIAKLKPDSHAAAEEILQAGPPYDPEDIGLVRHGVYLSGSEVVFVFEGPEVEQQLSRLLNDPAASAAFAVGTAPGGHAVGGA